MSIRFKIGSTDKTVSRYYCYNATHDQCIYADFGPRMPGADAKCQTADWSRDKRTMIGYNLDQAKRTIELVHDHWKGAIDLYQEVLDDIDAQLAKTTKSNSQLLLRKQNIEEHIKMFHDYINTPFVFLVETQQTSTDIQLV